MHNRYWVRKLIHLNIFVTNSTRMKQIKKMIAFHPFTSVLSSSVSKGKNNSSNSNGKLAVIPVHKLVSFVWTSVYLSICRWLQNPYYFLLPEMTQRDSHSDTNPETYARNIDIDILNYILILDLRIMEYVLRGRKVFE